MTKSAEGLSRRNLLGRSLTAVAGAAAASGMLAALPDELSAHGNSNGGNGHPKLATHPNPIYTQPVNATRHSDTDPIFNLVADGGRQLLANALPTSMIGETCAQLLQMAEPELNVVVASQREPLATQGGNAFIEDAAIAENKISALPFK